MLDIKAITELEKRDIGKDRARPRKPIFKSGANWKNLRLEPNEIGFFEGIKFVKEPTEEKVEEKVEEQVEAVKAKKVKRKRK